MLYTTPMLAKAERLPRGDFTRYFGSGQRFHTPYLTLVYTPLLTFRASVVVSKKIAKKAHDRNTIKRRLYASLTKEHRASSLKGVYILITKPPLIKRTRLEQHASVTEILGLRAKGR